MKKIINGIKRNINPRANLSRADLSGADLSDANLSGADLSDADLSGANLDYSAWPLCCGTKGVKIDDRILYQLIAHICVIDNKSIEYKRIRKYLLPYGKKSHRAVELGLVFDRSDPRD